MKRISILFSLMLICGIALGQTAKNVLDRAAAVMNNKGGVSANFTIQDKNGKTSGKIAVKGQKFNVSTPQAIVWFNGKTMWTYMKNNEEVNINTPSESELQAINPYRIINMYKSGYTYSMKRTGNNYQIHLKSDGRKNKAAEMIVLVNKTTYSLSSVKIRKGAEWRTISITNLKKANLSDRVFTFNAKDYPKAEIIDLR